MHGGFWKALTGAFVVGAGITLAGNAVGQQLIGVGDPAYIVADQNQAVATSMAEDDLAQRVADLEAALKGIQDKEAAAKKSAAGKMSVSAGGRIYTDAVWFGQGASSIAAFGDAQDTVYFRTARIFLKGDGFDQFGYKIQMDFAGRDSNSEQLTKFKDVYISIKELPLADQLKIGHFKEPFSLEELTSSRFITFMERGLPAVFSPSRNIGIAAYRHSENERMTFALGGFRTMQDDPPYASDDDGGYAFTMRATWLPWYDAATNGRGLLHVGLGYSYRDVDDPTQRIRQRPEVGVGPRVVDTGAIANVDDIQLLNPEIAFVYGPFSVQAEYIAAFYDTAAGTGDFHGAYVYASYFLTGENRVYKRTEGHFDRVKPFENFFRVCTCDGQPATGRGAWEVAYRYSWLDLDDADIGVLGGTASDHTIGLNWYMNPYTRLMFNYVHSQVGTAGNGTDADLNIFEMRAQIDF
ncbi:hypothetical protein JCM19992_18240 [Thermostilla marina]